MKLFSLAAAVAALVGAGVVHSASTVHPRPALALHTFRVPAVHQLGLRLFERPLQTSGTPTPGTTETATPVTTTTPTPAPTTTPTTSPYPDPVSVLGNGLNSMDALANVAFTDKAVQVQGNDKLTVSATAKASCKGPGLQAHITGTNILEGTSQKQKANLNMIQVGKKFFLRSKATKNKWAASTEKKTEVFGFAVVTPLNCPNAPQSSGGSSSDTSGPVIKDLKNLGPDTFKGSKVWHIQATGIYNDTSTGEALPLTYDWLVTQANDILVSRTVKIDDSAHGFTLTFTESYSNIGKKVTIKAPKIGSTKP